MPRKANWIPYLLLVAGVIGLLLIVVASIDLAYQEREPTHYLSSTSTREATAAVSPTSRSEISTATPEAHPTTVRQSTPRVTPTPASTPTPTPVAISPPYVSRSGAVAYVEGGRLSVVTTADSREVVVADSVPHTVGSARWSPDGRWLLYATAPSGPGLGAENRRQRTHIWDSQLGETRDLSLAVDGSPPGLSNVQDATWSAQGTRILFPCPANAPSCRAWVVDVTTTEAWSLSEPSINSATWLDEDVIMYRKQDDDRLQFLSVGPPAKALTKTVASSGAYSLSPGRDHVASLEASPGEGHRPHILHLQGHSPLSLSTQPTLVPAEHRPLWSPDARWVAYGAMEIVGQQEEGPYTILVDSLGIDETKSFRDALPVAWSPDGHLLAGFGCSSATCLLSVIDADAGQVTSIASAKDLRLWDLAWSPRGAYLVYSLSSSTADGGGLTLWDRATGEAYGLVQSDETRPLTDLQWTEDGCALYAAQWKERGEAGLAVSAIWGIGPNWQDRWRVAPRTSGDPRALVETSSSQEENREAPLCPERLLESRRLIAYYGTPSGPGLGILGRHGMTETLRLLKEQAQVYRDLDSRLETIPAFHMVTTIADGFAGADQNYNHRVAHATIRRWIERIAVEGGWSILDVQPGRASLVDEIDAIESLLLQPNVHLAVDPEFIVADDQVPGADLGRITASQINWLQARMDRVARAVGERKMLVIHQFNDRMVEHKEMILDYPLVDLVWDADGFGSPHAKVEDYDQYKAETGFEYGGFKIFYRYDQPVMTPEQVLSLEPPPRLVIYQ